MPILRAAPGFQVSRPVMEKVPYALKIETPESCLTLSARYEERKDRGSVGQDFARAGGLRPLVELCVSQRSAK